MLNVLAAGAGGFLGAVARYLAGVGLHRWLGMGFPWGTLAVNLIGCFVIGAAAPALDARPVPARVFVITGILGGFTTFSAFGAETVELVRKDAAGLAIANAAANLLLGLGAVVLGRWMFKSGA